MSRIARSCFASFLVALLLAVAPPRAGLASAPSPLAAQDSAVRVWVNTGTGVCHCPNSRYYGTTKTGEYLTEREARARGHRPAQGRGCSLEAALESTVRVWINPSSGVYHCPGSRYYGKTKAGTTMAEGDALRAGHRPANGNPCASG